MQESDAFAFRAETGNVIDQSDTCTTTAFQCTVQVIDGEADVVNAGTAFGDELRNGRIGGVGLEELDERVTRGESGDAGAIGIIELNLCETEQVAVERNDAVELIDGDAD